MIGTTSGAPVLRHEQTPGHAPGAVSFLPTHELVTEKSTAKVGSRDDGQPDTFDEGEGPTCHAAAKAAELRGRSTNWQSSKDGIALLPAAYLCLP